MDSLVKRVSQGRLPGVTAFALVLAVSGFALQSNAQTPYPEHATGNGPPDIFEGIWDIDRNSSRDDYSAFSPNPLEDPNDPDSDDIWEWDEGISTPPPGFVRYFFKDDYNPFPKLDPTLHNDGQKDGQYIQDWECNPPKSAPQKNNLVHGAAAYFDGLNYFGEAVKGIVGSASKDADNGTNYLGFWLFLDTSVGCTPGINSNGLFTGTHVDGDWLLISDYTKGGGVATFNAYRWNDPDFRACLYEQQGFDPGPGIPSWAPPIAGSCASYLENGDEVLGHLNFSTYWSSGGTTFQCATGGKGNGPDPLAPISHNNQADECGAVYESVDCNLHEQGGTDAPEVICATSNIEGPPPLPSYNGGTVTTIWDILEPVGADELAPPTYFEYGIDVGILVENPSEGGRDYPAQKFCGGRFMIESRTSAELFGASLKDYILSDFRVCGDLTVEKITVPAGDSQSFTFNVVGSSGNINDQIVANSNCSSGDSVLEDGECFNIPNLEIGNYDIDELIPADWDLTNIGCVNDLAEPEGFDEDSTGISVDLDAESITCTFTNTKRGYLKLVKNTTGGDGSFTFTNTDVTGLTSSLTTSGGTAEDTSDALVPGSGFAVSEVVPAGWDLTSASCALDNGGGAATGTPSGDGITGITVEPGKTTVCTFNNTKRGRIIVDKVTVPAGDSQLFTFNPSYGSAFQLADATTPHDSGFLTAGAYSVSESPVPEGWDLTNTACVSDIGDTETADALELDAGETITCTFTNTKRGKIIVDKVTVPAGDSQLFTFNPSYGSAFQLADATTPNDSGFLTPGDYSVSESPVPEGWDLTDTSCTSDLGHSETADALDLDPGETITCTFTNTKRGKIIVDKVTVPAGDGQLFTFNPSYGSAFQLADATTPNDSGFLTPGSYSVAESPVPAGWDLTNTACVSDLGDSETAGALDLNPGETITCTFTNTKRGQIIVDKVTVPAGDSQLFTFNPSYGSAFQLADATTPQNSGFLLPGGYSVSESPVPAGWDLTSTVCLSSIGDTESAGSLELDAGETITCTFTNTKRGQIIVDKVTIPSGESQLFTFNPDYGSAFQLADGTTPNNSGFLVAGPYSVSESPVPDGWDLTNTSCVSDLGDPETAGALNLNPGETITCTFTNTKRARVLVDKVTVGGDGTFTFGGAASGSITTSGGTGTSTLDSGWLVPGAYSTNETLPADGSWDATGLSCSVTTAGLGTSSGTPAGDFLSATLDLDAGDVLTCTYTNTKRAKVLVKKATVGADGTFTFGGAASGSITTSAGVGTTTLDSGWLVPGAYSTNETLPDGSWDATGLSCLITNATGLGTSSGTPASDFLSASLDLDAGDELTCTYTNTKRGDVDLVKQANGVDTTTPYTFTLVGPGVNETDSSTPIIDFGYPNPPGDKWLLPNATHTICETGIPAGTTAFWYANGSTTPLPFVGQQTGGLLEVYNPDDDGGPEPDDLGNRCVDFQVGPGGSLSLLVDNRTPLGDARTPGYWKNWSSCSAGNQFAKAADEYAIDPTGLLDARHYTLDEILTIAYSKAPPINSIHVFNDEAAPPPFGPGVYIGDLQLYGDVDGDVYDGTADTDCDNAVLVLNSSDQKATRGGKDKPLNHSNDPAYKLGRYLLAFIANQAAGAYQCDLAADAAEAAQVLLDNIDFVGEGDYLNKKGGGSDADAANALYYHGILGQYVENDPALNCGAGLTPPFPAP